ncbi:hypothetical protein FGO68_gene6083 [Halteria grandinella]|uniref:Uncharacterized protein n=1 Tax=Halteria grandinella TaxID=5974 RepID=A0A8J8P4B0_HALGN|nr:hypothetical protein FGO68_gene6083 [Halteria grandinella]
MKNGNKPSPPTDILDETSLEIEVVPYEEPDIVRNTRQTRHQSLKHKKESEDVQETSDLQSGNRMGEKSHYQKNRSISPQYATNDYYPNSKEVVAAKIKSGGTQKLPLRVHPNSVKFEKMKHTANKQKAQSSNKLSEEPEQWSSNQRGSNSNHRSITPQRLQSANPMKHVIRGRTDTSSQNRSSRVNISDGRQDNHVAFQQITEGDESFSILEQSSLSLADDEPPKILYQKQIPGAYQPQQSSPTALDRKRGLMVEDSESDEEKGRVIHQQFTQDASRIRKRVVIKE